MRFLTGTGLLSKHFQDALLDMRVLCWRCTCNCGSLFDKNVSQFFAHVPQCAELHTRVHRHIRQFPGSADKQSRLAHSSEQSKDSNSFNLGAFTWTKDSGNTTKLPPGFIMLTETAYTARQLTKGVHKRFCLIRSATYTAKLFRGKPMTLK